MMAVFFNVKKNHPLSWLPENGGKGQAAINTDAAQNFVRPLLAYAKPYMPPLIGCIDGLLPQCTTWVVLEAHSETPASFYDPRFADAIREVGGFSFGGGGINGLRKITG